MLDFEFTLLEYNVNTIFLCPFVQSENRRCELHSQPVVNKTTNSKLVVRHGWLRPIQAVTVVQITVKLTYCVRRMGNMSVLFVCLTAQQFREATVLHAMRNRLASPSCVY